jgi:hypothetical protein
MALYYKGEHGVHISYNPGEREVLEKDGWELIGGEEAYEGYIADKIKDRMPKANKLAGDDLSGKSVDELRDIAKDKGIKVHHKAGKDTLIEKLS